MLKSRHAVLLMLLSLCTIPAARAEEADGIVRVTLDFSKYLTQLDGGDGASVCQFHGSDPTKGTIHAERAYSTLRGFPNDDSSTEFGRFCDAAFSTKGPKGMGLSQVWSTPCIFQTPPNAVGDHYNTESWTKLDFSMYEPQELPREKYQNQHLDHIYGHTTIMLNAALQRARRENQRVLFWTDLHTDFPHWMWTDGLRKNPIREKLWEEACLHIVYFVKYLTARHGIPIHTVSFQNEPDMPARHGFTPEMLIRISRTLREKLDEAGLYGVRIMPYTSMTLNSTYVPWMKKTLTTLTRTYDLLEGDLASYQPYIDSLGGHMSHGEPPIAGKLPNTHFWRASGDFDNHWKGPEAVSFDMGPDDQIDEVIRLNTWLYRQGVNLVGIWQVALRMGHTVDDFIMPEVFDIDKHFRRQAIDGAATVYPHVRPGMFVVAGSQGREPRAPYSVDAFAGRGHRETIVITNSGRARTFTIRLDNCPAASRLHVLQCTASTRVRSLGRQSVKDHECTITVPADSVTALVAAAPATQPLILLIVRDAGQLSDRERSLGKSLSERYEVDIVSQHLTQQQMDRYACKRHPVDPMGAACYVLSDSIDSREVLYAHRTVMAPVLALGLPAGKALGVTPGDYLPAGESLSFRDECDPPAEMLEKGLPKACGPRICLDASTKPVRTRRIVERILSD